MGGFEQRRLFGALILLVTALFIAGGYSPLARWGRQLRIAAIGIFVLALATAVIQIILWLAELGR